MQNTNTRQQKASQEEIFNAAFEELNEEQKSAVKYIDGPLFVLAGPGTGKTQILALRIGYILKTTDTQPHNILCLTYTDAGTIAMRKRLIKFIGSAAYNVHIYTFHAFANQVIQENMHFFGTIKELQPLSDLEKVEVLFDLIDKISNDNPLKRFKGQVYYDKPKLENLFKDMKQEAWTTDFMYRKIEEYIEAQRSNPDLYYKRKTKTKEKTYEKGDLKEKDFNKILDSMEQLKAAAGQFESYEKLLTEKGRYDYDDMILWVFKAFKNNNQLLSRYQEQYLYFLVDEYQDTNGVQNKILEQLIDYWEKPNVFAVGDDDQSIYRFQGANMENISDFINKYNPEVVVLDKNYRSNQYILDASDAVIRNNDNRLGNFMDIDKHIIAKGKNANLESPVQICEYPNISHEETALYLAIKQMMEEGKKLSNAAVLYRGHKQVESLVKILEAKNIPLNVRKKVNILTEPFIGNILDLLKMIQGEYRETGYREDLLFKTLIAPIFHFTYADIMKIGKLAAYDFEKKKSKTWLEILADEELMTINGVKEAKRIHQVYRLLDSWIIEAPAMTVQVFFEKVITESGYLNKALSDPDHKWKMQLLNTLFDFIKDESVRNPKLTLKDLLESIDKMEQSTIPLPVSKILTSEDGIHFITGHSAKGLEFETVFIIGASAEKWEKKRVGNYSFKYPDTLLTNPSDNKTEDERRVFFVASTRAEKNLLISYSRARDDGKEIEASRFISEMLEIPESESQAIEFKQRSVKDEEIIDYKGETMEFMNLPETEWIDHDIIEKELENLQLSVTALNKYLRCPISYYYENIIRVPFARNSYAGFGNAVHYSLEQFFNDKRKAGTEGFGSVKLLTDYFVKGMRIYRSHFTDKEFDLQLHYGEKILKGYHEDQLKEWFKAPDFRVEHHISNVEFRGVPIKGVIDKIEVFSDHVNVIDYKTGKPQNAKPKMNPPKKEEDPGGDYWRQIIFYKMLVDNDPRNNWKVQKGEVNLVEPDKQGKYMQFRIPVSPDDMNFVGEQLTKVYASIKNHEFSDGCGKDNCMWCNFAKDKQK